MPMVEEVKVWDKESLAEKLGTTVEEVSTAKTLDWGWKELVPEHATALGDLLEHATNVVNLKCVLGHARAIFAALASPSLFFRVCAHARPDAWRVRAACTQRLCQRGRS